MIKVFLKKNANDCLYITSENNIEFIDKAKRGCIGARAFYASYSRDCGSTTVRIASLECQAQTLASIIYVCRENELPLDISAQEGHSLNDLGTNEDLQLRLALTESDMKNLFQSINDEIKLAETRRAEEERKL